VLQVLTAATVALLSNRPTLAVTYNWNSGTADWNNASHWSPIGIPATGDTANVVNTDGVNRTSTYDYTGPAVSLALLTVDLTGGTASNTETISMSAASLIPGRNVKAFSRHTLRKRFRTTCRVLGAARLETLTIHHGRHTFISHALAGGRSLAEVRDAAGHANVSITSSYLHVAVDGEAGVGNLFALL
jgi:hypothetical protein